MMVESAGVKRYSAPFPTKSPGSLLTYRNVPLVGTWMEPGGIVTAASAHDDATIDATRTVTAISERMAVGLPSMYCQEDCLRFGRPRCSELAVEWYEWRQL